MMKLESFANFLRRVECLYDQHTLRTLLVLLSLSADGQVDAQTPGAVAVGENTRQGIQVLNASLEAADSKLRTLDGRVAPLRQKVSELIDKLAALERREEPPEEPPEDKPKRQVKFRPPLSHEIKLAAMEVNLVMVCKDRRVSWMDLREYSKCVKAGFPGLEGVIELPTGDFDVRYQLTAGLLGQPVRKKGHSGMNLDEYQKGNSSLHRLFDKAPKGKTYLQIMVYPDSFDLFLKIRSTFWEREFETNWIPMGAGEELVRIGGSAGATAD